RPIGRWITVALVASLLIAWTIAAWARVRDVWTVGWMTAASALVALTMQIVLGSRWQWIVAALAGACLVPVAPRMRNIRGMFLLVGVPWLAFVLVLAVPQIGRFLFYTPGNDFWLFQRHAYRIVMQGYWLEGGEKTFWFQPLYRWIVGVLHLIFG